jgi:hypothetical protein
MRLPPKESSLNMNLKNGTTTANWLVRFVVRATIRKSIKEKNMHQTSTSQTSGFTSNSKEE